MRGMMWWIVVGDFAGWLAGEVPMEGYGARRPWELARRAEGLDPEMTGPAGDGEAIALGLGDCTPVRRYRFSTGSTGKMGRKRGRKSGRDQAIYFQIDMESQTE
jgi:hypothetical protein